jgi:hypothetical protein
VEVEFQATDAGRSISLATAESEQDRIASISTPYLAAPDAAPTPCDSVCARYSAWVGESLQRMATIRAGATRKQLLQVFTPQGGIVQYSRQTFVSWDCQYFKVDVAFETIGGDGARSVRGSLGESDADRVARISRPYLGWLIVD